MSDSTDTRDRVTGKALYGLVQINRSDRTESGPKFLFGCGVMNADGFRIFCKRHFASIKRDFPACAPVKSLLSFRRPAAIRRLIIPVAVNALQSKPRRADAHISYKSSRTSLPAVAYGYAALAVNCKALIARVFAPVNCVLKRRKSAPPAIYRKNSVFCLSRTDLLGPHAAATVSRPTFKASGIYNYFRSAITPKSPKNIPACGGLGPVNFYSNKPAVAKPCSVFSNRHGASYAR
jgi:hypothetical protein